MFVSNVSDLDSYWQISFLNPTAKGRVGGILIQTPHSVVNVCKLSSGSAPPDPVLIIITATATTTTLCTVGKETRHVRWPDAKSSSIPSQQSYL